MDRDFVSFMCPLGAMVMLLHSWESGIEQSIFEQGKHSTNLEHQQMCPEEEIDQRVKLCPFCVLEPHLPFKKQK